MYEASKVKTPWPQTEVFTCLLRKQTDALFLDIYTQIKYTKNTYYMHVFIYT